jgi:RNA polymerase sigma-70 factor (ECF subfamily)
MAEPDNDVGQWLQAARGGSNDALGQALELCRRYLLLIAERNLDSGLRAKGGASDLVQETFFEAQRDFGQFHGTTEPELRAWLSRLLLNNVGAFVTRYRGTLKRDVGREIGVGGDGSSDNAGPVLAAASPSPSEEASAREQAEALQRALARLPEDYRRVVVLRYREARSFEEIGTLMNRSADAARKLWARAMEQLREEWTGST